MKQKKEPIVKDERTMLLDGKIAGELVLGMTCFIALSAFVKSSILDLDLVAYLPEMFLLIAMGTYALLRRISSGIDIRDMLEKDSWLSRLGSGLVFAVLMIAMDVIGKREATSFILSPKYLIKILLEIVVFAILTYLLEKPLALINRKKQEKIEAELEEEEMRLQLLNKQIIDEREEGLANKAGAETAGFLFLALTVFSVGSIFTSKVGLSPIMVVALLIVSGLYYSVRCQRLGVRFISYSYLNVTGIVAVTSILSLFIWAQNFQLNQAVYQANPFHSKFLLVLPITFLLNLPIVWGVNTLVMLLAKVEIKRYEAYLDQLEKEE